MDAHSVSVVSSSANSGSRRLSATSIREINMLRKLLVLGPALAALVVVSGCGKKGSDPEASRESSGKAAAQTNTDDHHDKPGAHGGMLISLGADNYHAEAVFE